MMFHIPFDALEPCFRLKVAGAQPIIVGGWIRDLLMVQSGGSNDIDIEVFHITFERLLQLFSKEPHIAFPKFGVLRLDHVHIDLSLPRIERCTGPKYNDFCTQIKPDLSFEEAGCRRDFTVNAIGWNLFTGELLDPFQGLQDIEKKVLKPITEAFMEDSYRVLRAAQLIARFNFIPHLQLLKFASQMSSERLSVKHIQDTKCIFASAPHQEQDLQFLKKIRWNTIVEAMKA